MDQERNRWQDNFKAEKERLEEKFQEDTAQREAQIAGQEAEIHSLKVEISHHRNEVAQISDLQEEIERLKRKISGNDLASNDPLVLQRKKALEDERKRLEDKIVTLKSQIQSKDDEINDLTKANIAFKNEILAYRNLLEGVPNKRAKVEPSTSPMIFTKFDKLVPAKLPPLKIVLHKKGEIDILKIKPVHREVDVINNTKVLSPFFHSEIEFSLLSFPSFPFLSFSPGFNSN